MSEDRICVCPKCKGWFYVNKRNSGPECPDCQCFLICTNIPSDEFDSMPKEKRDIIRDKCFAQSSTRVKEERENDSTVWIRVVEIVNAIIISVSILLGISILVSAKRIVVGIIGLVSCIVFGLIIVSGSMMFVDIAIDIRAIRNKMDA